MGRTTINGTVLSTPPRVRVNGATLFTGKTIVNGVGIYDSNFVMPITAKHVLGYDFSGVNSTVAVTGAGVSSITDASGRGNTGTQGTDANRPALDTINSLQAALLDNDAFVSIPIPVSGLAATGMPPYHILAVVRVASVAAAIELLRIRVGGTVRMSILINSARTISLRYANGAASSALITSVGTLTLNTTHLIEAFTDGSGNASILASGVAEVTGLGAASSGDVMTLGEVGDTATTAAYRIGELHIFNDKLTAGELSNWQTYLNRWGY
jgi:hypothetical protein